MEEGSTFLSYQALATSWQPDHDNADPGVFDLNAMAVSTLVVSGQICGQHVVHVAKASCRRLGRSEINKSEKDEGCSDKQKGVRA